MSVLLTLKRSLKNQLVGWIFDVRNALLFLILSKASRLTWPHSRHALVRCRMRTSWSGTRLPPDKHQELYLSSPTWQEPAFSSAELEAKAARELGAWREFGGSAFGSSRRMVLELKESLHAHRQRLDREAGFTLDANAVARGDPDIRLPPYLPYYDPKQANFLKSRERYQASCPSSDEVAQV